MVRSLAGWASPDGSSARRRTTGRVSSSFSRPRAPPAEAPSVQHSTCQKRDGEEGVVFVRENVAWSRGGPVWSLFCMCDGRRGAGAAKYVKARLWSVLGPLLPRAHVEDGDAKGFHHFALGVRLAVVQAFAMVAKQFHMDVPDDVSGTTIVLALLCGRLLTVANLGDSKAVLDTGNESLLITVSHRIDDNDAEQERLRAAGVQLKKLSSVLKTRGAAGKQETGTLSCWPGGLTVSRSIGDINAGRHIVSFPHVYQALLPISGARVILGSDGLWDLIHWREATEVIRRTSVGAAATRIVVGAVLLCSGPCSDDASALVLDVLPAGVGSFPACVRGKAERAAIAAGGRRRAYGRALAAFLRGEWGAARRARARPEDDELQFVVAEDGMDLMKADLQPFSPRYPDPPDDDAPPSSGSQELSARSWAPAFLSAQRACLLHRPSLAAIRVAGSSDWGGRPPPHAAPRTYSDPASIASHPAFTRENISEIATPARAREPSMIGGDQRSQSWSFRCKVSSDGGGVIDLFLTSEEMERCEYGMGRGRGCGREEAGRMVRRVASERRSSSPSPVKPILRKPTARMDSPPSGAHGHARRVSFLKDPVGLPGGAEGSVPVR